MRRALAVPVLLAVLAGCSSASSRVALPSPSTSPRPSVTSSPKPPPLLGVEYPDTTCDPRDETTSGMDSCGEVSVNAQDKKVDAAFHALRAKAVDRMSDDPETAREVAQDLDAAQRTWLAFRRAQCVSESDEYFGGSMSGSTFLSCLEYLGTSRLQQLRQQLDDLVTEG